MNIKSKIWNFLIFDPFSALFLLSLNLLIQNDSYCTGIQINRIFNIDIDIAILLSQQYIDLYPWYCMSHT